MPENPLTFRGQPSNCKLLNYPQMLSKVRIFAYERLFDASCKDLDGVQWLDFYPKQ